MKSILIQGKKTLLGDFLLVGMAIALLATPVLAQRRGSTSRIRQMQAAQRQHEIEQLQKQIDESQKILDSVTTQGTLTEGQLEAARQASIRSRQELDAVVEGDRANAKKLREIEEKLIESQSEDSSLGKALKRLEEARKARDTEMHRLLRRPPPDPDEDEATRLSELAHLASEERETLAASVVYQEKKIAVLDAMEELQLAKARLFESSAEWKAAKEEHHQITQDMAEKNRSLRGAAGDGQDARHSLKTAKDIAAAARASISHARMRLREMGVTEKPKSDQKSTGAGR